MELYHASTVSIEHPIILNRHTCLDFGTGFYTTANRIQAEDFARRVYYRRGQEGRPTVNVYVLTRQPPKEICRPSNLMAPTNPGSTS